jgi:hypothetical protein
MKKGLVLPAILRFLVPSQTKLNPTKTCLTEP